MKFVTRVAAVCLVATCHKAAAVNPIQKVMELLDGLQGKIVSDGETAQKVYEAFATECKDSSVQKHQSIKTGKALEEEQKAAIEEATTKIDVAETEIEDLSSKISTDEKDLATATGIRTQEHTDFTAAEKELSDTIDTLHRATAIVERDMAKGASFVQAGTQGLTQALSALVDASSLTAADATTLTALVQNSQESESDDELNDAAEMLSAPSASSYESHSGGLVETLEGLMDKAQTQLAEMRETERSQQQSYDLVKQSLEDRLKNTNKQLDQVKADKGEGEEAKATTQKALEKNQKTLELDTVALSDLHHECMTRASDFEEETGSRGEELKALVEAKKVITEATGGAEDLTYGSAASFMQVSQTRAGMPAAASAIHAVRRLAKSRKSEVLAQLASRMEHTLRGKRSVSQADVFGKVKSMITEMIASLESEASAEAEKKAYCDKEMSETSAKIEDKTADIEKMTAKIDKMTSQNMKLVKEVAIVATELLNNKKMQAGMDDIRKQENDIYVKSKADLEDGVKGIQMALKVLRDYYSKTDKDHSSADGAGSSIIGLLEVCESDFSKGLSVTKADEQTAQAGYEEQTQDNEIIKAQKEQDKIYKTKESKSLEKAVADYTADRATAQDELDAIDEYMDKIKEECVAKAEPYAEKKRKREQEMDGLKQALEAVSSATSSEDASFLQEGMQRQSLRGVNRHVLA